VPIFSVPFPTDPPLIKIVDLPAMVCAETPGEQTSLPGIVSAKDLGTAPKRCELAQFLYGFNPDGLANT
jgi:hypothetical protein